MDHHTLILVYSFYKKLICNSHTKFQVATIIGTLQTICTSYNKNSTEGYVAPGKEHVSVTYNCNSYS